MGPPASNRVTRVRSYSGATLVCAAFRLQGFHLLRPAFPEPFGYTSHVRFGGPQPRRINPPVWPLSRSLAATWEIDVSFSSWGYLDVSVHPVSSSHAMCSHADSEICGSMLICSSPQLIAACHVLLRLPVPRHPPCALIHLNLVAFLSTSSVISYYPLFAIGFLLISLVVVICFTLCFIQFSRYIHCRP